MTRAGITWLRPVLARAIGLAAIWWALAEGSWYSPVLATTAIAAATAASLRLVPPGSWRWRPTGLLRFVPFFLRQSILGGVDVARRALDPRLPIAPGFLSYRFRLPPGPARVFFANTLSLLPGTLSTQLGADALRVHVLDLHRPVRRNAAELEARVADLFGVALARATD